MKTLILFVVMLCVAFAYARSPTIPPPPQRPVPRPPPSSYGQHKPVVPTPQRQTRSLEEQPVEVEMLEPAESQWGGGGWGHHGGYGHHHGGGYGHHHHGGGYGHHHHGGYGGGGWGGGGWGR